PKMFATSWNAMACFLNLISIVFYLNISFPVSTSMENDDDLFWVGPFDFNMWEEECHDYDHFRHNEERTIHNVKEREQIIPIPPFLHHDHNDGEIGYGSGNICE